MAKHRELPSDAPAPADRSPHTGPVRPGDLVTIHYTSSNAEGGVFETSHNRRPLQFVVGRDPVVEGVSEAVVGMRPGETRSARVPPQRGFGVRDPALEQVIPRSLLPDSLEEGEQLTVAIGEREIDVWVKRLNPDNAVIDANHPLAGETLLVEIELVSIEREPR